MAKAKEKVVVELNVNSAPPAKFSDDRRGYVLSKTQAALCAIDNAAIMESYARADTSSDPREKREALVLAWDWHKKNLFVQARRKFNRRELIELIETEASKRRNDEGDQAAQRPSPTNRLRHSRLSWPWPTGEGL